MPDLKQEVSALDFAALNCNLCQLRNVESEQLEMSKTPVPTFFHVIPALSKVRHMVEIETSTSRKSRKWT